VEVERLHRHTGALGDLVEGRGRVTLRDEQASGLVDDPAPGGPRLRGATRARLAVGVFSAMTGLSMASGPIIGGALVRGFGWHSMEEFDPSHLMTEPPGQESP